MPICNNLQGPNQWSNLKCKKKLQKIEPPPLENSPVHESTPWPSAGKIWDISLKREDWPLPPNYLDNNNFKEMTCVTSPKPPIKEESKTEEQSIANPKHREVLIGTKLPLLQEKEEDWDGNHQNYCKHSPNRRFRCPKQGAPKL